MIGNLYLTNLARDCSNVLICIVYQQKWVAEPMGGFSANSQVKKEVIGYQPRIWLDVMVIFQPCLTKEP
jgi:hypothetical protein